MHRIRPSRPTPALIIATVALFVALGGGAYAANQTSSAASKPFVVRSQMTLHGVDTKSKYAMCPHGDFATGGGVGQSGGSTSGNPAFAEDTGPVDSSKNFAHTTSGKHPVGWYGTVLSEGSGATTEYVWVVCVHP